MFDDTTLNYISLEVVAVVLLTTTTFLFLLCFKLYFENRRLKRDLSRQQGADQPSMSKQGVDMVHELVDDLMAAVNSLPQITTIDKLFKTMSRKERDALSISCGPVYVANVAQIMSQELEAIARLRNLGLLIRLYLSKTQLTVTTAPAELEMKLKGIVQMEKTALEYVPQLKTEAWNGVAAAVQAEAADQFLRETSHSQGNAAPDVRVKFLAPYVDKTDEPSVEEPIVIDTTETPRYSQNGNGKHGYSNGRSGTPFSSNTRE